MLRCSAILFDLDGTLIDSDPASEAIWREWAAARGVDAAAILAIHHGRRPQETIRQVAPHLDAEAEAAHIQAANAEAVEGVTPYPGVAELLERLPRKRYAIVTSAQRAVAVNRLTALGLWRDPMLVGAEDVSHGKPHPEGYLLGASLLGFEPRDCVVVEDAPAGVEAARAAGMRVLAVLTTHRRDRLLADAHLRDLSALTLTVEDDGLRLEIEP